MGLCFVVGCFRSPSHCSDGECFSGVFGLFRYPCLVCIVGGTLLTDSTIFSMFLTSRFVVAQRIGMMVCVGESV